MARKLKPLHEQVIFLTGATNGIGLATVHQAVEQGAKVFMTSGNEEELQTLQDEMRHKGYDTAYAVLDVGDLEQIQFAADQCLQTFGRIDTFINNSGLTISSKLMDTNIEEAKKIFDTNFWGVVNGCKVAVPVMGEKGGVIINIGNVLSKQHATVHGVYSASKHAVKAYTDALRSELHKDKISIDVSLIMPAVIEVPVDHDVSRFGGHVLTPPVYAEDLVAKAILRCALRPVRELEVVKSKSLKDMIGWRGVAEGSAITAGLAWLLTRKLRSGF